MTRPELWIAEMQDEITPRHQKTPGESGDRNLGGYFVLNFLAVAEFLMWGRLRKLNVELFESGGEAS